MSLHPSVWTLLLSLVRANLEFSFEGFGQTFSQPFLTLSCDYVQTVVVK